MPKIHSCLIWIHIKPSRWQKATSHLGMNWIHNLHEYNLGKYDIKVIVLVVQRYWDWKDTGEESKNLLLIAWVLKLWVCMKAVPTMGSDTLEWRAWAGLDQSITKPYHAILYNTMQYHVHYHGISCITMQYHALPCNKMQHYTIPLSAWLELGWIGGRAGFHQRAGSPPDPTYTTHGNIWTCTNIVWKKCFRSSWKWL